MKKHKHEYRLPKFPPVTETVVYDDEILIHPKPVDDDPNHYHDRSSPFTVKEEAPDCSSAEEDDQDKEAGIPMGPVKPKKCCTKTVVKGLHICEICGQDYRNKSDLTNHMGQHAGLTFNCEQCGKIFFTRKSFEVHLKVHMEGPIVCSQCAKNFEYPGSLVHHMKTHSSITYECPLDNCTCTYKSNAMYREHFTYGHNEEDTIKCDYCTKMFKLPTQMYCHRNKQHRPAPRNF